MNNHSGIQYKAGESPPPPAVGLKLRYTLFGARAGTRGDRHFLLTAPDLTVLSATMTRICALDRGAFR